MSVAKGLAERILSPVSQERSFYFYLDEGRPLDVVARSRPFVTRTVQPHVVAHIAEGLIVEDQCGGPAFEVDPCGNAGRTPDGDV